MRRRRSLSSLGILLALLLAAPLAHAVTLRFTGNPVPPDYVREKIAAALASLYGPGASAAPYAVPPLVPGDEKKISLAVTSQSGGSAVSVPVTLTDEAAPRVPGTFLLFSDHPEILTDTGLLFSAGIIKLQPVRLNYYHQNNPGDPVSRAVVIRVSNDNPAPALLHVIEAEAGPSPSIMATGHQATVLFLKRYQAGAGTLITIPANGQIVLSKQVAKGGDLVTGFLQIEELEGHPLQISVTSEAPDAPAVSEGAAPLTSEDTHAKGAYQIPRLHFFAGYVVGSKQEVIPMGDLPLENLTPGAPLKGTYGMLWEGTLKLVNPFPSEARIPVYFQPRGGSATATFLFDGDLKKIGYTAPYATVLLTTYNLPPKSERIIHFLSMPEGGSSYPICLLIGKLPPL